MNERFPIGSFARPDELTENVINGWREDIKTFPLLLRQTVEHLTDEQLDTPYRDGGWTVRQVVHHLADSHMNAFIRFKLALTEATPVIKLYNEAAWANLADSHLPVEVSLSLLEALHERWAALLSSLTKNDVNKTFIHPDSGHVTIGENIGIYAWHGRHHLAHITSLCEKKGWV